MMMRLDWIFISLVLSWFFAVLGWLCCWISGVFLLFSGAKSLLKFHFTCADLLAKLALCFDPLDQEFSGKISRHTVLCPFVNTNEA